LFNISSNDLFFRVGGKVLPEAAPAVLLAKLVFALLSPVAEEGAEAVDLDCGVDISFSVIGPGVFAACPKDKVEVVLVADVLAGFVEFVAAEVVLGVTADGILKADVELVLVVSAEDVVVEEGFSLSAFVFPNENPDDVVVGLFKLAPEENDNGGVLFPVPEFAPKEKPPPREEVGAEVATILAADVVAVVEAGVVVVA